MKAMKIVGVAGAAAAALALEAGTVVHYSLDSGEIGDLPAHGSTVVNVANPGVNDARLYGLKNAAIDGTSANMPYVTNGIPSAYRVYDPVSGQFPPAGVQDRALRFTARSGSGQAAVLQVENNASLRPESFTVEAMVRFPIGADLTQWNAIAVHPAIMKCANADAWGFRFISATELRVRFSPQQTYTEQAGKTGEYNTASGNVEVRADIGVATVCDGRWHHVAFTATPGASDSSKTDVKVFFDYLQKKSGTVNFRPQFSTEENCPLWIGASCQGATPFTGEIGEFRFSDEVLEPRQFLRPRAKKGYDPDVVLHYSFDAEAWFGGIASAANDHQNLVNNDADPAVMNGYFMTNALDGVGTFPCVASGSIYEMMSPAKGADLFWASSSSLENAYADNRKANSRIYTFPVDDWFCKTNFTVECFYKSNGDMEPSGVFVVRESEFLLGVGTKNHLYCRVGAGADAWSGSVTAADPDESADDQWHHAAMVVRQGESIRLYRDYRQVAVEELPTNVYAKGNVTTVPIGVSGGYNYNVFKGLLDEVRITLRALEPDEFIHEYRKRSLTIMFR